MPHTVREKAVTSRGAVTSWGGSSPALILGQSHRHMLLHPAGRSWIWCREQLLIVFVFISYISTAGDQLVCSPDCKTNIMRATELFSSFFVKEEQSWSCWNIVLAIPLLTGELVYSMFSGREADSHSPSSPEHWAKTPLLLPSPWRLPRAAVSTALQRCPLTGL